MRAKHLIAAMCLLVCAAAFTPACRGQEPEKVDPCQLDKDPARYNHNLIEVTGFVSRGFEDFGMFDPSCAAWPYIWLEYGGTVNSGTMYCCGVTNNRGRSKQLEIENISIPLIDDQHFRDFDGLIQRERDSILHSTIVGRFFAGNLKQGQGRGYGHMGCCSLLVIQQILSVDPHDRTDVDYGASPDQPDINKAGCEITGLVPIWPYSDLLEAQRGADSGGRNWVFSDPRQVASDYLANELKIDQASVQGMRQTRKAQGRFVYYWRPRGTKKSYIVVVSRPYWLSFYSRDPQKVAWAIWAAYESSGGGG